MEPRQDLGGIPLETSPASGIILPMAMKDRPATILPAQFIAKWQRITLPERAASQEHFIDLCRLPRSNQ